MSGKGSCSSRLRGSTAARRSGGRAKTAKRRRCDERVVVECDPSALGERQSVDGLSTISSGSRRHACAAGSRVRPLGTMHRRLAVVVRILLPLVSAAVFSACALCPLAAEPFTTPCSVPFESIKVHRAIDDVCPIQGNEPDQGHILQNTAKNNFCATGSAVRVTTTMLRQLQRRIDEHVPKVHYGDRKHLPTDRTAFRGPYTVSGVSLGEGSLVRFAGFIQRAHRPGAETPPPALQNWPAVCGVHVLSTGWQLPVIGSKACPGGHDGWTHVPVTGSKVCPAGHG